MTERQWTQADLERLADAIGALPPLPRHALRLATVERLGYAAIAERLGIGADEVERQIARALVLLDRRLSHRRLRRFLPACWR